MTDPDVLALGWVADVVGSSDIAVLRGLREGASPWLLRAGGRELVLRVGQLADAASFATEVAALRLAAQAAIPVAPLLAHDDGTAVGVPLVLTERLPGSSLIPVALSPARLRALGAAAARLHAVSLEPTAELPARDRPIAGEDFAKMRREQKADGLLEEAETLIGRTAPTNCRSVFVHGDLWHGNTLWEDGILTAWSTGTARARALRALTSGRCAAIPPSATAPRRLQRYCGWDPRMA